MSFKKPFRAVPIKLGAHQLAQNRRLAVAQAAKLLAFSVVGGGAIGSIAGLSESGSLKPAVTTVRDWPATDGLKRRRGPKAGDFWFGCREARRAGVTPIYAGEPGYSAKMDGDSDGIACEPYY